MNATADEPSSEQVDVQESNSVLLLTFWIFTLIISLILPFCWSKRQRMLCRQRLRERRWISDDGLDEDDWYYARYLRRQEERRQQEQERIQIAKNQQDEIREQYLVLLMRNYTMTLTSGDIHTSDEADEHLTSHLSMGEGSPAADVPLADPISSCTNEAAVKSTDDKSKGNASKHSKTPENDDSEAILEEMAFSGAREMVYVPQPGHKMVVHHHHPVQRGDTESPSPLLDDRRQAPSGCAICLSHFRAEERISWASNCECPHVFHHDCLLHWFQTVGSKDQTKKLRERPDMSDQEVLDSICRFPKLCPCCRQQFCAEMEEGTVNATPQEVPVGAAEGVDDSDGQARLDP